MTGMKATMIVAGLSNIPRMKSTAMSSSIASRPIPATIACFLRYVVPLPDSARLQP